MSEFARVCRLVVGFGLLASAGIAQAENLQEMLSGKTLTSPKGRTVYILGSDGALGGVVAKQKVVGRWEIRDGQWCRTISDPKEREGDACRTVEVNGDRITLSGDGQSIVYTMK